MKEKDLKRLIYINQGAVWILAFGTISPGKIWPAYVATAAFLFTFTFVLNYKPTDRP